jgi:sugar phosphate isomerase/epimerase
MRLAVSSYSFERLISSGEMTQFDCIAKAKEIGFEAIEFVDILPQDGFTKEEYARVLAQECAHQGIRISCFTFGADFILGSKGDTQAEIERVKKMIDLAAILGVNLVRHDATRGDGRPFDTVLPLLGDACREVTIYAATKGIRTTVENHGFFCQDSERVEKLYRTVSHKNFGILGDMGNFLCADESPEKAFGRIAPFIFYVHAKDFYVKSGLHPNPGEGYFYSRSHNYLKGTIVGHGDVPIMQCLSILKNIGYDSDIAIEFEGMEDTLTGITIGYENLKRYINAI